MANLTSTKAERELELMFGRGLRRVRQRKGMKQTTVARLAGYTNHTNITKIEGGESQPSFAKAVAIARVLNVSIEVLLAEGCVSEGVSPLPPEGRAEMAEYLHAMAYQLQEAVERHAATQEVLQHSA